MKTLRISFFMLLPLLVVSQQVYITTDTELANVNFESGKVYIIQGNLTTYSGLNIENVDDVLITGLGSGSITAYVSSDKTAIIRTAQADNIRIEDLLLTGETSPKIPLAGVFISGHWSSGGKDATNVQVNRCEISYVYNGVRGMPASTDISNVTVDDCHIHHIAEDGVLLKNCPNATVTNSYIHHVNTDYGTGADETAAPGDGIQFVGDCDNFLVEGNTIVRRKYANKFDFIYGRGSFRGMISGSVIGNTMIGPFNGGYGGATMYLDFAEYILVKDNYFVGIPSAPVEVIHSRCDNVDLINNVFDSIAGGSTVGSVKMYNDAVLTNINGNLVKNSSGIIFHCYGTTNATDNEFCNFDGTVFYKTPGSGTIINETGTVYSETCDGSGPPPDPDPDPNPCDTIMIHDTIVVFDTFKIKYFYRIKEIITFDTVLVDSLIQTDYGNNIH